MKKFIWILFLATSCSNQAQRDRATKFADDFISEHSQRFLKEQELLKYSYEPRGQFYHRGGDTNVFRILLKDTAVTLICSSDSCLLNAAIEAENQTYIPRGRYLLKKDEVWRISGKAPYEALNVGLEQDPISLFSALRKSLADFKIFAYSASPNLSVIKIYYNVDFYLLRREGEVQGNWSFENDVIIKDYGNGWYLMKSEPPLDQG